MVSEPIDQNNIADQQKDNPDARGYEAFCGSLRQASADRIGRGTKAGYYFDDFQNWVGLATLIAVVLYTAVTILILVATKAGNQTSADNLVYANRANVSISDAQWFVVPGALEFVPRWENSGNVATKGAAARVNFLVQDASVFVKTGFTRLDYPAAVVPLSIGAKATSGVTYFDISEACFYDLEAKRSQNVVVWGRINYFDGFTANVRTTQFCWVISGAAINWGQVKSAVPVSYELCDEGNCTDQECSYQPQPEYPLPIPHICKGNIEPKAVTGGKNSLEK